MNYREYKRMALSRDADPATVERGVLAIRSEMIETLSQLEDRLSPRRVFDQLMQRSRKPEMLADAAYHILTKPAKENTGNLYTDEEVLKAEGVTDFSHYAVAPGKDLQKDLFIS